jgi:uncharacterized repeat protein (TIGR03943 family)
LLTFAVLLLPVLLSASVSPDSFGRVAMENRGIDTDGSTLRARKTTTAPGPVDMPLPSNDPAPATPATAGATPSPTDYLQRTADGSIVVEVLDLLYAAQDNELRKDFENKRVELIGQLMPDKSATVSEGPQRFKAVRMFMTCCAADARPVATFVETAKMPDLPEMTWVRITGTSTFPLENGRRTAILKADKIDKANPPDESMLY